MKERVTIIDVAKAAGVSKSTVSLVLQNSMNVSSQTRKKIVQAMDDLGYVYHRGAANLRRARAGIVGVIVNDLTNSFFAELAVGIDTIIQSAGFVQILSNTGENILRQREVITSMLEYGISGLIISPARGTEVEDLQSLTISGIPILLAVRRLAGVKFSSLATDNTAAVCEAVGHLANLGHKRIAFIGGFNDVQITKERVAGYHQGLMRHGLMAHFERVVESSASRAGGLQALQLIFADALRPTAAVCFNDAVALGVCDGLRQIGIEPGRDFAIVGFDDIIEAKSVVPSLTTVAVDPQGMGSRAAQILLEQINSTTGAPRHYIHPSRLVVRESSGVSLTKRRKAS